MAGQVNRGDGVKGWPQRTFILGENRNHSYSFLHYTLTQFISFWLLSGWLLILTFSRVTKSRWGFVRVLFSFMAIAKFIITGCISPSTPIQEPWEVCGGAEEARVALTSLTPSGAGCPLELPTLRALPHFIQMTSIFSSQSPASCIWPAHSLSWSVWRGIWRTLPLWGAPSSPRRPGKSITCVIALWKAGVDKCSVEAPGCVWPSAMTTPNS